VAEEPVDCIGQTSGPRSYPHILGALWAPNSFGEHHRLRRQTIWGLSRMKWILNSVCSFMRGLLPFCNNLNILEPLASPFRRLERPKSYLLAVIPPVERTEISGEGVEKLERAYNDMASDTQRYFWKIWPAQRENQKVHCARPLYVESRFSSFSLFAKDFSIQVQFGWQPVIADFTKLKTPLEIPVQTIILTQETTWTTGDWIPMRTSSFWENRSRLPRCMELENETSLRPLILSTDLVDVFP
jgi:hypothetical protein